MRVGRVPPGNWIDTNAKDADRRIFYKGYVDHNTGSYTEGTFKCPTVWDQVEPKGAKSHWYCQFSVNRALIGSFGLDQEYGVDLRPDRGPVECVNLSDVKSNRVVLLGDCGLNTGGGVYPSAHYSKPYWGWRTESELRARGPWPYRWTVGTVRVDYYGHTGEKSNLTFLDGHGEGIKDLVPEDFNID